ncbi:hypothetical protein BOTBODRAFT_40294 [Botryobasidium botryosum FD-172 SS1]|uniref:Cyclin N-terminal domain-containing protein n=1 Tax=Botryobasidium botryosum (strain FD-172 SS1) TaxID=930990 RepID=A0A067NBN8_BOTB1|nr:hypothetical protein BOTBODRAFT_40294 [Botryobasidium botryosum FD-172 SS1]
MNTALTCFSHFLESTVVLAGCVWNINPDEPLLAFSAPVAEINPRKRLPRNQSKAAFPPTPTSLPPSPQTAGSATSTSAPPRCNSQSTKPPCVRLFIHELLRRSRTSCSTLEVALCYLAAIHPKVVSLRESPPASDPKTGSPAVLLDPRRTVLASIVLAAKFLQDRAYSNRAWAKLTGLDPIEVTRCERALGDALSWRLWVGRETCVDEARLQTCVDEVEDSITQGLMQAASDAQDLKNAAKAASAVPLARTRSDGDLVFKQASSSRARAPMASRQPLALPARSNSTIMDATTCPFSDILRAGIQSSEMQMAPQRTMSSISANIQLPRLSLPFPVQASKSKSQESGNGISRTYSESASSSAIVNPPIFGLRNDLPGSPLLTFLNSPYTATSIDASGAASFAFLGNIGSANNTSNNNGSICGGQQYASPFQLTPLQSSSSLDAAKPTAAASLRPELSLERTNSDYRHTSEKSMARHQPYPRRQVTRSSTLLPGAHYPFDARDSASTPIGRPVSRADSFSSASQSTSFSTSMQMQMCAPSSNISLPPFSSVFGATAAHGATANASNVGAQSHHGDAARDSFREAFDRQFAQISWEVLHRGVAFG